MKYLRSLLFQFLFSTLLITQGYSEDLKHLNHVLKSVNDGFIIAASKDQHAAKILSEMLQKNDYTSKSLNNISARLETVKKEQRLALKELKAKTPHLGNISKSKGDPINFLDLRIDDAFAMLEATKISPQLTQNLLMEMRDLAVRSANSTNNSTDRYLLDIEFQSYKSVIPYAQMIDLIDGFKILGEGDLKVAFGNDSVKFPVWNLHLPAIDIKSLNIADLYVSTGQSSMDAITIIDAALDTLARYRQLTEHEVTDMQVMLITLPYMLQQNFTLMIGARDYSIMSLNSTLTDLDRDIVDTEFNYLKAAMQRTQTYLSLIGPIMTGAGKFTIQIGDSVQPSRTLKIDLPTTDIHLLRMDALNLRSFEGAREALINIQYIMRNFVYHPITPLLDETQQNI